MIFLIPPNHPNCGLFKHYCCFIFFKLLNTQSPLLLSHNLHFSLIHSTGSHTARLEIQQPFSWVIQEKGHKFCSLYEFFLNIVKEHSEINQTFFDLYIYSHRKGLWHNGQVCRSPNQIERVPAHSEHMKCPFSHVLPPDISFSLPQASHFLLGIFLLF